MKVAVVGSGISGIGAAWLLSQKHEVHLFESDSRLGGHANTVQISEDNRSIAMDTGFLVYNELTYPNLIAFFKALNVVTADSDMSLSVQVQQKKLEWAGANLNTVFGQRINFFKPQFHRMLFDIIRFGKEAEENLAVARRHAWSLGDMLLQKKYSKAFCTDYLLPIGAAIWSTPEDKMLNFPAATFISFFLNHKLLQVNNRPVWRTVKNGSINYVQKAAAAITNIHLNSGVKEVERLATGRIAVRTESDSAEFDKVILATHTPISAKILKNQSQLEMQVLSSIQYEANHTLLHKDSSFMPKQSRCWSSWNVLGANDQNSSQRVSLTYYLNKLQPLETRQNYFVTLNPTQKIVNPLKEFNYSHPQFDQKAIRAQRDLPSIQGNGGVYFAGAWTRYGFHEDGLLSAVQVAKLLNVPIPWSESNE